MKVPARKRNRRIIILEPARVQEGVYGTQAPANADGYTEFATVSAEVQDILPPREQIADGVALARRQCRIQMNYRTDITSDMRLEIKGRSGSYRIISEPAELGNREGLRFNAEQITTEGQEP